MQLYLLRHANADTIAQNDDERFLSEKGMVQAQRVAVFCDVHEVRPDVVLTSPLRRARQTAAAVTDRLKLKLQTADWLESGVTPETIIAELQKLRHVPAVMIVGHEPDFGELVSFLTGSLNAGNFKVRKASLILFTVVNFERGGGRLEYSVPAKFMKDPVLSSDGPLVVERVR